MAFPGADRSSSWPDEGRMTNPADEADGAYAADVTYSRDEPRGEPGDAMIAGPGRSRPGGATVLQGGRQKAYRPMPPDDRAAAQAAAAQKAEAQKAEAERVAAERAEAERAEAARNLT